jgi:hypothetical protein
VALGGSGQPTAPASYSAHIMQPKKSWAGVGIGISIWQGLGQSGLGGLQQCIHQERPLFAISLDAHTARMR